MSNIAERIAVSCSSTQRITPVSPSPPMVAANSSAFSSGDSVSTSPEERASPIAFTCAPKVPDLLVVLAVHVVGDRAAERDELGPRHDRREPAVRHGHAQQPVERQPGLGAQHAALAVEGHDAVEPVGDDQPPALVQAHIAVGAAHPEAQARPALGRRRRARFVEKCRAGHLVRHAAQPTP